jgi:hypothetical protein
MFERRSHVLFCLALVGVSLAAGPSRAANRVSTPRFLGPYDATVVRNLVDGAKTRLQEPGCRALLDEFTDPDGVRLSRLLEDKGLSVEEKLAQVRFVDASDSATCQSGRAWAFTARGWLVVHVCPRRLEQAYMRERTRAEGVIIHELLHTIGLGENPPSSTEITLRVERSCRAR